MKIIQQILVAVIGGIVGGLLAYLFAVRTRRHEVLLAERLSAFKAIQAQLVGIRRYCESRLAYHRLHSGGFSPRTPEIVPSNSAEALALIVDYKRLTDENQIFLSRAARDALLDVYLKLDRIREIEQSSEPEVEGEVQWDRMQHYSELRETVERSEEILYRDLRLPE